jgi:hypothetical protein
MMRTDELSPSAFFHAYGALPQAWEEANVSNVSAKLYGAKLKSVHGVLVCAKLKSVDC